MGSLLFVGQYPVCFVSLSYVGFCVVNYLYIYVNIYIEYEFLFVFL